MLDQNRIRYIDPDSFAGLPRLRELRLEENGLRSLSHLHHLTGLQVGGGRWGCARATAVYGV